MSDKLDSLIENIRSRNRGLDFAAREAIEYSGGNAVSVWVINKDLLRLAEIVKEIIENKAVEP